jgi:hypothetical protein
LKRFFEVRRLTPNFDRLPFGEAEKLYITHP